MTHPFSEIINYHEDDWQEFFERICLIDIFMPVIKAYPDPQTLKCVVRYIVYTYSQHSDKVVLGMDWQKNKQQIFEHVGVLPRTNLYSDLVLLKNEAVLETVHRWLDHQDSDVNKELAVLKDLRVEMQLSANSKIMTSSKDCDYDQKYKNAEYSLKLKQMIKDLEQELIQNDSKMKEGAKEVKMATKEKNSRSVGSYAVR